MKESYRDSFYNDINKNTMSILEGESDKVLTADMAAEEVFKALNGRR
jgi:hypothetical protein